MAPLLLAGGVFTAPAVAAGTPDLKEILTAGGGALGGLIEGVFTTSNLKISDISGQWTSQGSAVSFKSEKFLKKAGGTAVAGAVESQLDPYYKKYGLTGAVLEIDKDGNFSFTIKKISLKGTVVLKSEGIFTFNFTAFGTFGFGSMDAYIEKTGSNLSVMFDADKIKKIISFAATISGNKLATAADKLLQEYDGICIGFEMKKTGESAGQSKSVQTKTDKTDKSGKTDTVSAIDALRGLFGQ